MKNYLRELNPTLQQFILTLNGFDTLDFDEDSSHCEIEFGEGFSINIHAAASDGSFCGIDSNPSNIFRAEKFSLDSTKFLDSMLDYDLPRFDSISIHENFSKLSLEDRTKILEFVRDFLKPGGIFFIRYDSMPGCTTKDVIRSIIRACPSRRVEDVLEFIRNFIATEPNFLKTNPAFIPLFEHYSKQSPEFFEQEFFSNSWRGFYFEEICEILRESQLEFACSTDLLDTNENLTLTAEARDFLKTIEDPIAREQLKDFFLNRSFRRDLFVRGATRLTPEEWRDKIDSTRFILLTTEEISNEFQTPIGIAKLDPEMLGKLVDFLREDQYRPKSFEEITKKLESKNLLQMLVTLIHREFVAPCHSFSSRVKKQCENLNAYLMKKRIRYLSSPITGGGIPCDALDINILDRMKIGRNDPSEIARELRIEEDVVQRFFSNRLPLLRELKIV